MLRKQIRDSVKAIIESVYDGGPVYTNRVVDARNLKQYVAAYFDEGDTLEDGMGFQINAAFVIRIQKQDLKSDDELDEIAEPIHQALLANRTLDGQVSGIRPEGFRYEEVSETQHERLSQLYTVVYQEIA